MLTALVLTTHLLAQTEDAPAGSVETIPAPVAKAPERGVSLTAGPTEFRKSTNFFIATGGIALGAIGGYLGMLGGILINFSKGGLSDPLDSDDVLLLMVIPAVGAAAFSWLVGLFDLSQRTFVGSAIWALLGAAVGEGAGLGLGYVIGRGMFPNDAGTQGLVLIALGPALAAIGSVVFMELFKPGQEIGPSISLARGRDGALVVGPAFGGRF